MMKKTLIKFLKVTQALALILLITIIFWSIGLPPSCQTARHTGDETSLSPLGWDGSSCVYNMTPIMPTTTTCPPCPDCKKEYDRGKGEGYSLGLNENFKLEYGRTIEEIHMGCQHGRIVDDFVCKRAAQEWERYQLESDTPQLNFVQGTQSTPWENMTITSCPTRVYTKKIDCNTCTCCGDMCACTLMACGVG